MGTLSGTPLNSTHDQQPGCICLVNFPYTHGARSIKRPSLVVARTLDGTKGGSLLVMKVTGSSQRKRDARYALEVGAWEEAGLRSPSTILADRVFSIQPTNVLTTLGRVRTDVLDEARRLFLTAFQLKT